MENDKLNNYVIEYKDGKKELVTWTWRQRMAVKRRKNYDTIKNITGCGYIPGRTLLAALKYLNPPTPKMDKELKKNIKSEKEIREAIREIEADDRFKAPPALVNINAPLALIQMELEGQIKALKWVLS
jgi:hypothetical protein